MMSCRYRYKHLPTRYGRKRGIDLDVRACLGTRRTKQRSTRSPQSCQQEPAPVGTSLTWRPRSGKSQRNCPFHGHHISRPQGAVVLRESSNRWSLGKRKSAVCAILVRNYGNWAGVPFIKAIKFPLCKVQIDNS